MEDIVIIDEIPYRLSYDQHITVGQRSQTIEEIRMSLGYNSYEGTAKVTKETTKSKR